MTTWEHHRQQPRLAPCLAVVPRLAGRRSGELGAEYHHDAAVAKLRHGALVEVRVGHGDAAACHPGEALVSREQDAMAVVGVV